MKKLTSLVLSLALGMSALPSLSSAYATNSNYDPNDLYEQFLQKLQDQGGSPSSASESPSQADVQPSPQPVLINEKVEEPVRKVVLPPAPIKDEGQVSLTGRVVRVNPLYLEFSVNETEFKQIGSKFMAFPSGKKLIYVLLTSADSDIIDTLLRASGNFANNYVMVSGTGVDNDNDGYLDAISMNGKSAGIKNLLDPRNNSFEKEYVEMKPYLDRTYRQYYGEFRINLDNQRAYVWMTNSEGQALDRDGRVITNQEDAENPYIRDVRIAYNESDVLLDGAKELMWKVIFDLGRKYSDLNTVFLNVGFLGFVGTEISGAEYVHVGLISLIREVVSQISPGSPDETAPRAAAPSIDYTAPTPTPAPAPAPAPVKQTDSFTLKSGDVVEDNCFHQTFFGDLVVTVQIEGDVYTMTVIGGGTSLDLTGVVLEDGTLSPSSTSGQAAGFNLISATYSKGRISIGTDGGLPGNCPIIYSVL
jgi:hypothetical protein